jgi:hypothetical protein
MEVTLAIRFDNAKNAEIAAISQMSSSLKPWPATSAKSASETRCASHVHCEVEHGALAPRDIRLAVVDGGLVGDLRILCPDSQDRAVRDDAIMALVGAGGRDHDHLALGLGQTAVPFHQGVVIGKERAEFVGPISQRQEDVRNEAGFFLHREQAGADIFRQRRNGGRREASGDGLRHGEIRGRFMRGGGPRT